MCEYMLVQLIIPFRDLVIQPKHHSEPVSTVIGLAQEWALQEGNTLRALGAYVITRCSPTTVGRQGHDVMAGFG